MLFLRSSRAYQQAGHVDSAVVVLNEALGIAHETPRVGVGFDPSGAQQEAARREREARLSLRAELADEAASLERLIGPPSDVRVVVRSTPPKQRIRYWSHSEGPAVTRTLETDDSVMVKGQRFYFVRQRPGGMADTIIGFCNKPCNIKFPAF
jgi:hypothetical protein